MAKLPDDVYEAELLRLQTELVKLQEWVRAERQRVVVVFEGATPRARAGDQADHAVPQPPRGADRGVARAERA